MLYISINTSGSLNISSLEVNFYGLGNEVLSGRANESSFGILLPNVTV